MRRVIHKSPKYSNHVKIGTQKNIYEKIQNINWDSKIIGAVFYYKIYEN